MLRLLALIFLALSFIDSKYILVETEDSSEARKVIESGALDGDTSQGYDYMV